jgi:hypothetical protein
LLFCLALACIFWNGIVTVLVAVAVNNHLDGRPDWWLTISILPFVLGGVGLLVYFVRQLGITSGIGPTVLEVAEHPLRPGKQYELFVSQSGRFHVDWLTVDLVSEENALYRQGTHARTETRRVYQAEIFRREGFDIGGGAPFETRCALEIPARAMHTFRSEHNEVHWKLLVRGRAEGWPEFTREFSVIVYPRNGSPPS